MKLKNYMLLGFLGGIITSCNHSPMEEVPDVLVNNLGYGTEFSKQAIIKNQDAFDFSIIDLNSGEIVFKSNIVQISNYDESSGDFLRMIDFSDVRKEGTYAIFLNDTVLSSHSFSIKEDVYAEATIKAMKGFYYQRCGVEVVSNHWSHPACHLKKAGLYNERFKQFNVTGGWHDAGDYNKFAVTHNISLAFLIQQFLDKPEKYTDGQISIQASDNGIPDLIDEIKWGLDWLLKMQAANGGVYHKVSIKNWTGENLPHKEEDEQYLFDISSTASAGSAAVFAKASILFERYDPDYADKLEKAAIRAWQFLEEHPVTLPLGGFVNPPGVEGGEYRDNNDKDERLWASVELYKMTGEAKYLEYYHDFFDSFYDGTFKAISWINLRNMAGYSYLEIAEDDPHIDIEVRKKILKELQNYSSTLLKKIRSSNFKYALRKEEYYWGSNSIALGYAFDLIQMYKITGEALYQEYALDQLHYILGRNPLGISFVTGVGSNAVEDPYHQFSKLNDHIDPVPGMVVGGANYYSHIDRNPISEFTAKNYEDSFRNYMVNEPAINYSASFSYVAGYFSSFSEPAYQKK